MNYIKNVGDNQNKFGDTATVFQIGLMKDDEVYNFGDNQVTVNIANEAGYVLSVTPDKFSQNTVLNLDFNKVPLKNLTPDSYRLEVEVTSNDGDISKFPTSGAMTFSINHDLKETRGELVPTVTFDNVLEAVDEKIAVYMDTVKVGPQGPVGPAGNVDTSQDNTFTGTNTFNQKIIAPAGVQGNADTATKLQTPRKINGTNFDGTADINVNAANDNNLVHLAGNETIAGNKTFTGNTSFSGVITGGQVNLPSSGDLNTLTDTGKYYQTVSVNVANWTNRPNNAPNYAFSVDVIGQANRAMATQMYRVHTTSRMWVRTMWLDGATIATSQWAELANDATVVHNIGTETINGDKTFTSGNYGLRVTSTGIQKTSDKGVTWTNI